MEMPAGMKICPQTGQFDPAIQLRTFDRFALVKTLGIF
jgi:hypothetical protein